MKRKICVDCGKSFTLSDSELDFYQRKGLSEPKRCKQCREKKKQRKAGKANTSSSAISKVLLGIFALALALRLYMDAQEPVFFTYFLFGLSILLLAIGLFPVAKKWLRPEKKTEKEIFYTVEKLAHSYSFANAERLEEHYAKHKAETGAHSKEEYVRKANAVIQNPHALHKIEAEDGDDVYFVEDTGEIVFVSKYDHLRTYYIATKDYFNRT